MTRLLIATFLCLIVCFFGPAFLVFYFNLDHFEEAKWKTRVDAMEEMRIKANEIKQEAEKRKALWKDAKNNPLTPKDIQAADFQLKANIADTIALSHKLEDVLLEGAIKGGELDVTEIVHLNGFLALSLAAVWLFLAIWWGVKFGIDRRANRMVAQTILRDVGVNVKDIPAKDRLRVLQKLGMCKWHLGQVNKAFKEETALSNGKGTTFLCLNTTRHLFGLLDRADIATVSPDLFGSRELDRKAAEFSDRQRAAQKQMHIDRRALEEKGAERVRKEFKDKEAELGHQEQRLRTEREAIKEQWETFKIAREYLKDGEAKLRQEAPTLQALRNAIEHDRSVAARDRGCAEQTLEAAYASLAVLETWGNRLDSAVIFLQGQLATLDPEGKHPDRPAIVHALAKALDAVELHRNGEPAHVI